MRIATPLTLFTLALLAACNGNTDTGPDPDPVIEFPTCTDADGDGRCAEDQDCDDSDPEVYVGHRETCNGLDDNCNDIIDEGMSDADQDGTCDGRDVEECDGLDNDGDGIVDEDFGDEDGDGIADCVDSEVCDGRDNDGDGTIDEGFDADSDGFTQCGDIDGRDVDCDDADSAVYPGASETADRVDNDCDGLIDEGGWSEGDMIITEVMINPSAVGDRLGEWVELFNNSGRTLYLNGLQLRDSNGQNHQIAADGVVEVAAGAYAVLANNGRPETNGRVQANYVYTDITMANVIDDLQVWAVDQTGAGDNAVMLDAVSWDASYPIIAGSSMSVEPGHISSSFNDDVLYWCASSTEWDFGTDFGSPGQANPLCNSYDGDGDGITVDMGDCDDANDEIYPGAPEIDASVDNDCDGRAELGPIVSVSLGEFSETEVCGVTYLDASGAYDPDGGTVEGFEWRLTAKPTGSKVTDSSIRNSDRDFASFEADVSGSYTFQVRAYDNGDAAGEWASLTVTIDARTANNEPTADAGENQVDKKTSTCESLGGGKFNCTSCEDLEFDLDGTASRDRDGDSLSYLWTITSGAGSLSSRTTAETTVKVSGATPVPGGRGTSTVFIDLVVTDCMGDASAADTVAIVYTCEAK